MDICSNIKLENDIYIYLILKNGRLDYKLEYPNCKYNCIIWCEKCENINNNFNIYEKKEKGFVIYNSFNYEKIKINQIEKDRSLNPGCYLFVYNKTKLFVEFIENKISYYIEDNGITEINLG